jgi:hypothetical protein
MTTEEWSPEEWHRRMASLDEDVRVFRAMIADMRDNANFLRERGHHEAAAKLDETADNGETVANEIQAGLDEARASDG